MHETQFLVSYLLKRKKDMAFVQPKIKSKGKKFKKGEWHVGKWVSFGNNFEKLLNCKQAFWENYEQKQRNNGLESNCTISQPEGILNKTDIDLIHIIL